MADVLDERTDRECYVVDISGFAFGPYRTERLAYSIAEGTDIVMWLSRNDLNEYGCVRNWK